VVGGDGVSVGVRVCSAESVSATASSGACGTQGGCTVSHGDDETVAKDEANGEWVFVPASRVGAQSSSFSRDSEWLEFEYHAFESAVGLPQTLSPLAAHQKPPHDDPKFEYGVLPNQRQLLAWVINLGWALLMLVALLHQLRSASSTWREQQLRAGPFDSLQWRDAFLLTLALSMLQSILLIDLIRIVLNLCSSREILSRCFSPHGRAFKWATRLLTAF
jgi:hypothetical protein